ncbi:hypothetical protein MMC24_000494 [Lignoscripta atroalba]|nr:hypothetical protein [Lignoscripta atroalba]
MAVRPSIVLNPEITKLPPPDQFAPRFYVPMIFCFRLKPNAHPKKIFSELQAGLSITLVELPFFAGRVVTEDATRGRIQLEVCPDDEVTFKFRDFRDLEAKSMLYNYDELERAHFPMSELIESVLSPRKWQIEAPENPCLVLQANFIKGGLLLACLFHHSTSDAIGWSRLLRRWSHHTATTAKGSTTAPVRFPVEALDRSPLFKTIKGFRLEDCPQFKLAETQEVPYFLVEAPPKNAEPISPIIPVYWYFSRERLKALQTAAQSTTSKVPSVSANDALCALLWRRVSVARLLKDRGFTSSALEIPCNVRARLNPRLRPDYMGNAVCDAYITCFTDELYSTAPDALPQLASRIHQAVADVDSVKFLGTCGMADSMPTVGSLTLSLTTTRGCDMLITTVASLGWHSLDWGVQLGSIDRQRLAFSSESEAVMIQAELEDGGLEVFTNLEAEVIERLQADKVFTEFAEFRCH